MANWLSPNRSCIISNFRNSLRLGLCAMQNRMIASALGAGKVANIMATIAVAMSGGVDRSVAAAILKNQGNEIVGFTMQLWNQRRRIAPDDEPQPSRCCSLDDVYDARCVAN